MEIKFCKPVSPPVAPMDTKYSFSASSILSSEEITLILSKRLWAEIFRGKVKDGPSVIENFPSSY